MPERKGVFEGAGSQQLRPVVHPPLTRPCFVPIKRMETEPAADLSSDLSSPRFFRLILVDLQPELCREFEKHFSKWPDTVQVVNGRFENLPEFDCMVSAANSFGLMDGGVDAAITRFFGEALPAAVRRRIIEEFEGEQPVGTSFIIETGNAKHPFLAHTPTMRVPYSIRGTDYVYLAMKAMLSAVKKWNKEERNQRKIRSVACTGLGTFYGKMDFAEAARQMALAYNNFLNPPRHLDWNFADRRQQEVIYGGYEGFLIVKSEQDAESRKGNAKIAKEMAKLARTTRSEDSL